MHQPDQAEEEVEVSESEIAPREQMQVRGTRTFPRFPVTLTCFELFKKWLQSIDGKERSEKMATEMVVDVSKFLKFCAGPVASEAPNWNNLLNRNLLLAYVTKLKDEGMVQIEGRLAKLDTFESALKYLRANEVDESVYQNSVRMSETLNQWRTTWRKD